MVNPDIAEDSPDGNPKTLTIILALGGVRLRTLYFSQHIQIYTHNILFLDLDTLIQGHNQ